MMNAEHYTHRVRSSAEDEAYAATVADVLDDMTQTGEIWPTAIWDRTYSGKFMVRVPPAPTARHRGGRAERLIEPTRCHPPHRSVELPL